MLNSAIDKSKANGASSLFLEVRASNLMALKLYKTSGFNAVETRQQYYSLADGQKEDVRIFRLEP